MAMRATVFALGFLSASSLEFVSQTFNGNLTMSYSPAGPPTPTIATVEIGLDMQAVKLRQNTYIMIDMAAVNITTTSKQAMIFDAETKRATMYTETVIKSPTPVPSPPASCKYFEFPSLPAPAAVAKCLQDVAHLAKPAASENGLQKFKMDMPVPQAQGAAEEEIYTDKDFIMKKVIADISVTGEHPMKIHEEIVDMNSHAGVPDSSTFVVPTEWGTCEKTTLPPVPSSVTNNPIAKLFLHCLGASQAPVVV